MCRSALVLGFQLTADFERRDVRRELCHRVCCCLTLLWEGSEDSEEEELTSTGMPGSGKGARAATGDAATSGEELKDRSSGGAGGSDGLGALVFEAAHEGVAAAICPASGGAVRIIRAARLSKSRSGARAAAVATQEAAVLVVSNVLADVTARLLRCGGGVPDLS